MIELKYKTGLRRIGAAFIDGLIVGVISFLISMVLSAAGMEDLVISEFVLPLLPVVYSVFMSYKYGRTVGKYSMELAIIDVSETRKINFEQAFLRELVYTLAIVTGMSRAYYLMKQSGNESVDPVDFFIYSDYAYLIWFLLEILTMFTNNKRRALHDFMAGTVIVRTDRYSNPDDSVISQLKWPGRTNSPS